MFFRKSSLCALKTFFLKRSSTLAGLVIFSAYSLNLSIAASVGQAKVSQLDLIPWVIKFLNSPIFLLFFSSFISSL